MIRPTTLRELAVPGGRVHQPQRYFFQVCILFENHILGVLLSNFVVLVSVLFVRSVC